MLHILLLRLIDIQIFFVVFFCALVQLRLGFIFKLAREKRLAREQDLAERKRLLNADKGRHLLRPLGADINDMNNDGERLSKKCNRRKRSNKPQYQSTKPLYLRMQENFQKKFVEEQEAERQKRLKSRHDKFKSVSLEDIRDHQQNYDREAAEARKRKKEQRAAELGQYEVIAIGSK